MQDFIKNEKYDILTINGWEDFSGVIYNQNVNKPSKLIKFENGTYIKATNDHKFFCEGKEIDASLIEVGMILDGHESNYKVIEICDITLDDTYEIFKTDSHTIVANGLISHQCDEMSFIPPNIVEEWWSAMRPTLSSTRGKCLITSTPCSDDDLFSSLVRNALINVDEDGNEIPGGIGRNGFKAIVAKWWRRPDRDEEWAKAERATMTEEKFKREYECLSGDTVIEIMTDDGQIRTTTLEGLFYILKYQSE